MMDWNYFPFSRTLNNSGQAAGHMWKESAGWVLAVKTSNRWQILNRDPIMDTDAAMKALAVAVLKTVFL